MICPCGANTYEAIDGLCRSCRLRRLAEQRTVYHWTPEMEETLTKAYRHAKSKTQLTAAIGELQRRWRFPRCVINNRATKLGLRRIVMNAWKPEHIQYLRENAGAVSLTQMAKRLRRSRESLKNKMCVLGISATITEGFSRRELCGLFGVRFAIIDRWIGRGWLELDGEDRITYESIADFVWDHMDEYHFASCEEWWLKTMLKPAIGNGNLRSPREAA